MNARDFWKEYYKDDPKFPLSEAACQYAEAYQAHRQAEQREPDGYAYRYPDKCLRFSHGETINGGDPIEAIPYYFRRPSGQTQQWIPVSRDHLPETDQELQLFTQDGWRSGWFHTYRVNAKPYWNIRGEQCRPLEYVTHWQALPAPPKQEG